MNQRIRKFLLTFRFGLLCLVILAEGCSNYSGRIADSQDISSQYLMNSFGEVLLLDSLKCESSAKKGGVEYDGYRSSSGMCNVLCAYRDGFLSSFEVSIASTLTNVEKCYLVKALNGCRCVRPVWHNTYAGEILVVYAQIDTHSDSILVFKPSYDSSSLSLLYFSPINADEVNHRYIDFSSIRLSQDCILEYGIYYTSQDSAGERKCIVRVPVLCYPHLRVS